jgi:site-specific recombinase XerD
MINFLMREEIEALLAAPDQRTWNGRRDHALLRQGSNDPCRRFNSSLL